MFFCILNTSGKQSINYIQRLNHTNLPWCNTDVVTFKIRNRNAKEPQLLKKRLWIISVERQITALYIANYFLSSLSSMYVLQPASQQLVIQFWFCIEFCFHSHLIQFNNNWHFHSLLFTIYRKKETACKWHYFKKCKLTKTQSNAPEKQNMPIQFNIKLS